MKNEPTALIETGLDHAQLIGVSPSLRACVTGPVIEVWFESSEGAAQCEKYVRALLRREANLGTRPAYVLTTRPAESEGDGKMTIDGYSVYRVTDATALEDSVMEGWNSELQPFVVFVDGPAALPPTNRPHSHSLCDARFAVACGADGCVAQLIPLTESLTHLRSAANA